MAASTFEETIRKAVENREIPGVVLLARDKSGSLNIAKVTGHSSIEPGAEKPLDMHSVFKLASMTKLLTAVSALQVVERGLIGLDDDLAPLLPELAAQPVLAGFEKDDNGEEKPVLVPRDADKPITLRRLLTHTSGVGYYFLSPELQRYYAATKQAPPPGQGAAEACFAYPLIFQPGEGWSYGGGIDWAGRAVEKLAGQTLEDYMAEHIFDPLGIPRGTVTFHPERYPDTALARLWPSLPARDPSTGKLTHAPAGFVPTDHDLGGQGLYADVTEYFKVLVSLLLDDGKLLRPETAALLFEPHITSAGFPRAHAALVEVTKNPEWIVGDVPDTREYDWSLGGLLVDGDSHAYRRRGTTTWGGMLNLSWIIDRKAGVCALFGTNMLPPGDPKVKELTRAWEEYVYSQAKSKL